ncbi:MAG TPA: hypothetical protein VGA85_01255 [Dehalococcoidales bacterium]
MATRRASPNGKPKQVSGWELPLMAWGVAPKGGCLAKTKEGKKIVHVHSYWKTVNGKRILVDEHCRSTND